MLALFGDTEYPAHAFCFGLFSAILRNALPNSSPSSSKEAPAAEGLAETTRSRLPGTSVIAEANTSLSLLRTVFRVTAFPTFRDTESPRRGVSRSFGKACTENNLPLKATPCL